MVKKILGNKILVKPLPSQEKTSGGLIIPAVINKEVERGQVIEISDEVKHINVGDILLYSSRSGTCILIDDITFKFLNGPTNNDQGEILAII